MPVTSAIHDFVAVITFSNPPVNGLGQTIRRGLIDALNEALENDAVKAIVFDLIADLAWSFSDKQLDSLFGRLKHVQGRSTGFPDAVDRKSVV